MSRFGSLTKKKSEDKTQTPSGGVGSTWKPIYKPDDSKQNLKGNQSVVRELNSQSGRTMIPRRKDIERILGKPKEDAFFGLKKNSTNYRPVLDHLDALNQYLDSTELAPDVNGMNAQLDQVIALMKNLEEAVGKYVAAKKNNQKAIYLNDVLLPLIRNVRVNVIAKINQYRLNPPDLPPKWYLIANASPTKTTRLDDSMATGATGKGGINQVQFFQLNSSQQGVFKETKDEIEEAERGENEIESSKVTEYEVAHYEAKIDIKDARLAERNVALYRLDKLLGGDVIPRTEFAIRKFGGAEVKGTIMDKVSGVSGSKVRDDKMVADESEKTGEKAGFVNAKDPNLQRLLSRLQLIDALAYQVDRHEGNFFVEFDNNGKVIGVKGIDNDMAFGSRTDVTKYKGARNYAGIGKYVDKEMAQRILALRPEDLEAALGDLLGDKEMAALLQRLTKIQQELQSAQLLDPDQWNDMTAMDMVKEQNNMLFGGKESYYARMVDKYVKPK